MLRHWKLVMGVGGALLTLLPLSAQAGSDGRKNTAIVLGAAAAYELLKGKTGAAVVLGAGAAYAGKRYEDARKDESNQKNRPYYYGGNNSYNNNTYSNDPYYNGSGGYNNNDQDYENYNARSSQYGTDRQYPYRSSDRVNAYEQMRGNKRGWNGQSLPPGQLKKQNRNGYR